MEAIRDIMMPDAPALVAGPAGAVWLDRDGEIHGVRLDAVAGRMCGGPPPLLCHMPAMARRLNIDAFAALDLLELFAFVHPERAIGGLEQYIALFRRLAPGARDQLARFLERPSLRHQEQTYRPDTARVRT
jgi:hypothetical protein